MQLQFQLFRLRAGLLAAALLATTSMAQSPYRRTLLGGNGYERVQGVTVDAQGLVYVTGHTNSTDMGAFFAGVSGGFDTTYNGDLDGFVAVFSPDLRTLLHWTLLGGTGEDRAYQVELDPAGEVVVVGLTGSADFPRTGGAPFRGGWDVFIARFSPDLQQLNTSTLLGGTGTENPRGSFTIDAAGNVFVGGHTSSFDFPVTAGAVQTVHAAALPDDWDAFVAKVSPAGQVLWATYLGGTRNDSAHSGLRLAPDGSVVVAGMTNSSDFPTTPGAFQPTFGGHGAGTDPYIGDGFVARLSADGSQLVFSTYLGGSETDNVAANDALELDAAGNVIVIGQTLSPDFPIVGNTFDHTFHGAVTGQYDAFVAKLALDGSHLIASTYLGGEQSEEASGLAIGLSGEVYLSGNTHSSNFPVSVDANQPNKAGGLTDGFVVKLSNDLRYLAYSSYIGGSGNSGGDRGRGLTLTPGGDVLLGGDTDSSNLPLSPTAYDTIYAGGAADAFVSVEQLTTTYPFGQGKTNSLGLVPILRATGSTSAAAGNLKLRVANAVPGQGGCFAYGSYLIDIPYQGGVRYMGLPITRGITLQTSASGMAAYPLTVTPGMYGETRVYQFWYRDPQHPDGTGAGLTNGLKITFLP